VWKWHQIAFEPFAQVGKYAQMAFEVFPQFWKCPQMAFEPFAQFRKYEFGAKETNLCEFCKAKLGKQGFALRRKWHQIPFEPFAQVRECPQIVFEPFARFCAGKFHHGNTPSRLWRRNKIAKE
ncbi:MAG: hypothetical protein K2F89_03610, partial [Treponemataceae bacterium]|nr:hypothetical protein [Treponemataceae bacterium]